jgi:hypothetical protein
MIEDTEEKWVGELLVNDSYGIYIPSEFAKRYGQFLTQEQRNDLSDPDNEFYWDTWDDVLLSVKITIDGKEFSLYQEGDLWAIPV